jgi:hypothetical protein
MEAQSTATKADWLDAIPLKGKVFESKGKEFITLEARGALVTVNQKDVRHSRDAGGGETEIFVAPDARITYETRVSPREASGILSREAMVEIVSAGRFAGGECECSRCSGGECECSRCTGGECECSRCTSDVGRLGRFAGGECECSRCSGGECECSRCIDARFGGTRWMSGGGFRRRIG